MMGGFGGFPFPIGGLLGGFAPDLSGGVEAVDPASPAGRGGSVDTGDDETSGAGGGFAAAPPPGAGARVKLTATIAAAPTDASAASATSVFVRERAGDGWTIA